MTATLLTLTAAGLTPLPGAPAWLLLSYGEF